MVNLLVKLKVKQTSILPPAPDLRLSRLPPDNMAELLHDAASTDGAHGKPDYEPRGFDLPETEKQKRNEYVRMILRRAKLWFDAFVLCAPADLEKLPFELRQAKDANGNTYLWLNDYWYRVLTPLEQWWLFLIYWSRAFTNKQSIDLPGFYDPITSFGFKDDNGEWTEFWKEGVTTCGNVVWIAQGQAGAGVPVWCIDALADPLPSAEQVIQYAFLMHAATVSTTVRVDPTPTELYPKGTWRVEPFGYFNGNVVPVPLFSIWEGANAATMIYEGIPLRLNWFESERVHRIDKWTSPYVPDRPLFPRK